MGDTSWFEGTVNTTGAGAPPVKSSWASSPAPARWTSPRSRCPGFCGRACSSLHRSCLLGQPNGCGLIGHFADRCYLFLPAMTPWSRHILWSHHAVRNNGNDGENTGHREGWMWYTPGSTGIGYLFPLPALTLISKKMRKQSNANK